MAVDAAGQPILDDLAIAERQNGRTVVVADAKLVAGGEAPSRAHVACNPAWRRVGQTAGYVSGFCLEDAAYYASIGDPPSTAQFRRALALVGEYTRALTALADGTSAKTATGQVQQLARDAASLASAASPLPGVQTAVGALATSLGPLIQRGTASLSAAQERRIVLASGPQVGALIDALKAAIPAMFDSLIARSQEDIETGNPPHDADLARIEGYRVILSNYAELLDRLRLAWNQLVLAAGRPSNPANLESLTRASAEVAQDATVVRKSLAELRRGAPAQ